ncbi:hypothetical protein tinsulaeT_31180 [Thalassotalea insulae]|uniref:DUF3545 family protein n=1 Tax=Thalassotalea insulae TaxID=2056778 RepID=A0ABQ6GV14_9GAMM|nr:hypothetical protein [Thalassotalea insulae]GLX79778.1 hypothetical protein tinsulaeT_31180 [Thalassotalea insulae]
MNLDNYDDTDLAIDDDLTDGNDSGIAGFEIAYGSSNKTLIKRTAKQKGRARHRLELLKEKRHLDREIDTLSDYWN